MFKILTGYDDIKEVDVEKLDANGIKKAFNLDDYDYKTITKMDELSHDLFNEFKKYINEEFYTGGDFDWDTDWSFGEIFSRYFSYDFDINDLIDNKNVKVSDEYYEKHHWIEIFTKLRKQICVGSIFLSDYENNLGIDDEIAYNLFNGYEDWVSDEARENGEDAEDNKVWCKYDTEDQVENWIYAIGEENPEIDKAIIQHELSKLDLI